MNVKKLRASLLAGGLSIALPCAAQTNPAAGSDEIRAAAQLVAPFMDILDCENNGFIDRGEPDEHVFPIFRIYDSDQSRWISRDELLSDPYIHNKRLLSLSFDSMDRNADGKATVDELRMYLNRAVDQLDGNRDGDLYPEEFNHARLSGQVLVSPTKSRQRERPQRKGFQKLSAFE